ncbi:AlkA N-terminal domain-containing protein [Clavibacter tessellarius]|uniref:DNA-3-methyladenine glycosylase family protein n=1 Tax=Clavibacter tessellarius TaxID=31965 RepID=UPI0032479C16
MDSPGAAAHVARTVLDVPGPFDGGGVIRFLSWHAVAGAEEGDATTFTQSARLAHGAGTVTVRLLDAEAPDPAPDAATRLEVTTRVEHAADAAELLAVTRRLLGLDVDSARIDADLARDPALAAAVRATPGLRIPGTLDPRSTLFRTIVGQQISVASARATHGRMTADLGEDLPASVAHGSVTRLPPTAARIARDGHEPLRGPARRTATLIHLAEALETGETVVEHGMPRAGSAPRSSPSTAWAPGPPTTSRCARSASPTSCSPATSSSAAEPPRWVSRTRRAPSTRAPPRGRRGAPTRPCTSGAS